MDLFERERRISASPLAERMRSDSLDDFIGQEHIVGKDSLLRRAIKADKLGSCIFYGPTGTGKTTLANIIAKSTNSAYERLNAVSSGVNDAKEVIKAARDRLNMYGRKTFLLLDECHRWNKAQSDSVLEAIEKGDIIFIGSTTENPYISMTSAIISRCRVFEFKKLKQDDIYNALLNALKDKSRGLGNYPVEWEAEALTHIACASDGDLRVAFNALELAVITTNPHNGIIKLDVTVSEQSIGKRALSVSPDNYYDMLSAFCKSLRGSDPDAALYWSERLLSAGVDPMVIARRLVVHSAEDVGLADPEALRMATSAMYALERIGLPEGRIPLSEAIIYICMAPKSNSVVKALAAANAAVINTKDDNVPSSLLDTSYRKDKTTDYKYPHDFGGWVDQQYLPNSLKAEKFYVPSENGREKGILIKKSK